VAASNVCLWRTFGKYTRVNSQTSRPSILTQPVNKSTVVYEDCDMHCPHMSSLPDLSGLQVAGFNKGQLKKLARGARSLREKQAQTTDQTFHIVLNNCAQFALRVFGGLVTCKPRSTIYGPILLPRACRPFAGGGAYVPSEEQCERIIATFLTGMPARIRTFKQVLELVQSIPFTPYLLASCPHDEKVKLGTWPCHALIGLLFHSEDAEFGVTFGAYPESGRSGDGCFLLHNSTKMEVVLGDAIERCARETFPRKLVVKAAASASDVEDKLIEVLTELSAKSV